VILLISGLCHPSMSTGTTNTEAAIFSRMMDAAGAELTAAAARSWLSLEFSIEDRTRMHELALKAQSGDLLPDEEEELGNYRDVGNVLAIMHSRARRALTQPE